MTTELKDLGKLREELRNEYLLTFWNEDRNLPDEFMQSVTKIGSDTVKYNKNSFIIETSSRLKIYFPNQLWFIAAYITPYFTAIEEYASMVKDVLKTDKEDIKKCQDNADYAKELIDKYHFSDSKQKSFLIRFLSDYKWWGGGKTIDRQDYYYSPVISLSGLVNASQGYVAELCRFLSDNPSELSLLQESNYLCALHHSKRLVVAEQLSEFAPLVFKYLSNNGKIEALIPFASYSDSHNFGDGSKKVKIITTHSSLIGLFLANGEQTMLNRPDKERWTSYTIEFDNQSVFVSNQWNSKGDYQLTLTDLQNMLDDIYPNSFSVIKRGNCFYLFEGKSIPEYNTTSDDYRIKSTSQLIYFGAPGTSKSTTIKRDTEGKEVHRITFHPDTDYSNFVGCYKPTKPNGQEKLTYEFVAQTFTKAYIAAWKKLYGQEKKVNPQEKRKWIKADDGAVFTIVSIDNDKIVTNKDMGFPKEFIGKVWEEIWKTGEFKIKGTWNKPIEWSICKWIYDNVENCKADSFEEGWSKLMETLLPGDTIEASISEERKVYILSYDSEDIVHVLSPESSNIRKTIAAGYEVRNNNLTSVKTCLQELLRDRDADNFDKAWEMINQEFNGKGEEMQAATDENKEVFLIIEEINRGNCAQIFGDLFQLLDRRANGYSDYEIEPDSDLQGHLRREFAGCDKIPEEIRSGEKIMLPPNLYIWATMNTSDQSLFPIDSAFKRRWEWKYMPIKNEKKGHKIVVTVEGKEWRYDWWEFLEAVNGRIEDVTESEDKKLGYWFVKPKRGTDIGMDTFVGKVVFYLWNDVFKDYGDDENSPFMMDDTDGKKKKIKFHEFFDNDGKVKGDVVKRFLEGLGLDDEKDEQPAAETAEQPLENPTVQQTEEKPDEATDYVPANPELSNDELF